jgi:hypothetical protein
MRHSQGTQFPTVAVVHLAQNSNLAVVLDLSLHTCKTVPVVLFRQLGAHFDDHHLAIRFVLELQQSVQSICWQFCGKQDHRSDFAKVNLPVSTRGLNLT